MPEAQFQWLDEKVKKGQEKSEKKIASEYS